MNGIHEVAGSIPASSTKSSLSGQHSECLRGYPLSISQGVAANRRIHER
ncbi:hypothetical protein NSPZN2_30306 [Nitrospira defluvii]|uniref:Uncharacterized protein n=1 Tax=Nitrospira defluvii TaxID=330214 RepID=A0ABM8RHZ7_9BACT|nr:hypothetical protein NSPZN2_30306 [Nitrospira defluvii]